MVAYFYRMINIIATGASLKGKDLTRIEGKIMAVNYAFKYVDYDYLAAFDDPIKYGFPVDDRLHTNYDWIRKYNLNCNGWSRKHRKRGLVLENNREIFGRSGSLFCGINVAFKLGYNKINVYGADMALTDGYCHFYDEKKVDDQRLINHYERSFKRHKETKRLFLSQIVGNMEINFLSL